MFERAHHRRMATLLGWLDADLLRECGCLFGGGTAVALRFGEYRESRDADFLVSDADGYRRLREMFFDGLGLAPILRERGTLVVEGKAVRADQYGIRCTVTVDAAAVKFEIVREARIRLDPPAATDVICGVATLTLVDMAASKLLANADRWSDDGAFNRDVIDLAMMKTGSAIMKAAQAKAEGAYGKAIMRDLGRALTRLRERDGWMDHCMKVMDVSVPRALLWQRLQMLQRFLDRSHATQ